MLAHYVNIASQRLKEGVVYNDDKSIYETFPLVKIVV